MTERDGADSPTQRFQHLLARAPLYEAIEWSGSDAMTLIDWLRLSGSRIDAYCPACRSDTTFVGHPMSPGGGSIGALLKRIAVQTLAGLRRFEMTCARDPTHLAVFCLDYSVQATDDDGLEELILTRSFTIQKIGQSPPLADFAAGRFREYHGVIAPQDLAELRRAAGLAAHGIGIGSFVYLRRIFERLKERARLEASKVARWNEVAYQRSATAEQIKMLAAFLPPFVVENRAVYSILSLGLHELSESECIEAYIAVETAVLLMLDEIRNAREREKRIATAGQSIASLRGKLARKT